MTSLPIIRYRMLWYSISGSLVAMSIVALLVWGLKIGIDFTGGTSVDLAFPSGRPAMDAIEQALQPFDLGAVSLSPVGAQGLSLRARPLEANERGELIAALNKAFPSAVEGKESLVVEQFQTIGPV